MTATQTNQLLTAKQLGLLLALSKRQIFRLHSCGKLPRSLRIGGSIRWKSSDISDWQDMNCPDRRAFEAQMKKDSTNDQ
jgi:predicted DNA-binding transcriptional regulator AlpA